MPDRTCTVHISVLLCAALLIRCQLSPTYSGSSEIGNPEKVAGAVVDSTGAAVRGLAVALVQKDFIPMAGPLLTKQCAPSPARDSLLDTTDDLGAFRFDAVPPDTYNLVAAGVRLQAWLYRDSIAVAGRPVDLGTVQLLAPATVLVKTDSSGQSNRVAVVGTGISVPIGPGGIAAVQVPAGQVKLAILTSKGAETKDASLAARQVLDLSGVPDSVSRPVIMSQCTSGVSDSSYRFWCSNARSNKRDDLQYRFSWGDGTVSAWVSDTLAVHSWAAPDTYAVTAQARSARDTTVFSPRSDALRFTVTPNERQTSLTAPPRTPQGPTDGWDDTSYAFGTGGARNSLGGAVEYSFEWGDGSHSAWSLDSLGSHAWPDSGTYPVRARARSAADTTALSPWSPAWSFKVHLWHVVQRPKPLVGPATVVVNVKYAYTIPSYTCSQGHPLEYAVDWGDQEIEPWKPDTIRYHTWTRAGTLDDFMVHARCSVDSSVFSEVWSVPLRATVLQQAVVSTPLPPMGDTALSLGRPDPSDNVLVASALDSAQVLRFSASDNLLSAFWSQQASQDSAVLTPANNSGPGYIGRWSGPFDARLKAQAAFSARGIYLLIEITDDIWTANSTLDPFGPDNDIAMFFWDSRSSAEIQQGAPSILLYPEMYPDAGESMTITSSFIQAATEHMNPTDLLSFTYGDTTYAQNRGQRTEHVLFASVPALHDGLCGEMVPLSATRKAMEWFIPWSHVGNLRSLPPAGSRHAFTFGYYDGDTIVHMSRPELWWKEFNPHAPPSNNVWGDVQIGPDRTSIGTFRVLGGTCSDGHTLQYRFAWGDADTSRWTPDMVATHAWFRAGSYAVKAQSRCAVDTTALSPWSDPLAVSVK